MSPLCYDSTFETGPGVVFANIRWDFFFFSSHNLPWNLMGLFVGVREVDAAQMGCWRIPDRLVLVTSLHIPNSWFLSFSLFLSVFLSFFINTHSCN